MVDKRMMTLEAGSEVADQMNMVDFPDSESLSWVQLFSCSTMVQFRSARTRQGRSG